MEAVKDGAKAWAEYQGIRVEVVIEPTMSPEHVALTIKVNGKDEVMRLERKQNK